MPPKTKKDVKKDFPLLKDGIYQMNHYYCGTGKKLWYADTYGDGEWYVNLHGHFQGKDEYDENGYLNDAYDEVLEEEEQTFQRLKTQLLAEKNIIVNKLLSRTVHNSTEGTCVVTIDIVLPKDDYKLLDNYDILLENPNKKSDITILELYPVSS
jgi:hypothetical protein